MSIDTTEIELTITDKHAAMLAALTEEADADVRAQLATEVETMIHHAYQQAAHQSPNQ